MNNSKRILLGLILGSSMLATSHAQVLMLNFRASSGPSGGNLTNSPYNTVNPSFSDTTWNNVSNTDVASGLSFADGTAATGIGFNLGVADLDVSTTVNLANNPGKVGNLGSNTNTGIYGGGNAVGVGGVFDGDAADRLQIGLQVTGLAAGTYDVFITGRNTNGQSAGTLPYTYYAAAGTSGANFDFSGYDNQSVVFSGTGSTSAWVEAGGTDANYAKITVTLSAGQALNIVSNGDGGDSGTGGDANRGFLNSVQVVSIPEPQTWALIFGACVLAGAIIRRRS